jgi:hypothetical protein
MLKENEDRYCDLILIAHDLYCRKEAMTVEQIKEFIELDSNVVGHDKLLASFSGIVVDLQNDEKSRFVTTACIVFRSKPILIKLLERKIQ